jgi:glycosyltransferase involved in cell wall biosynthesis
MKRELVDNDFNNNFIIWARGVDKTIFNSSYRSKTIHPRPYLLYVGRVSIEKNIEAFLKLDFPEHDKIVVGNGPDLERLEKEYNHRQDIKFVGAQFGNDLASWYAGADCFVFPSKTDTYGIVMIESLCCGTPVAGYPVTGPNDIITCDMFGDVSENLQIAVESVLFTDKLYPEWRAEREQKAQKMFSWDNCADIFINSLVKR